MIRVVKRISSGKIVDMASIAVPGTLIANAVLAGLPSNDLVEEDMTVEAYNAEMVVAHPAKDRSDPAMLTKEQRAMLRAVAVLAGKSAKQADDAFQAAFKALPGE